MAPKTLNMAELVQTIRDEIKEAHPGLGDVIEFVKEQRAKVNADAEEAAKQATDHAAELRNGGTGKSDYEKQLARVIARDPHKGLGLGVARFARCLGAANNDFDRAAKIARQTWNDPTLAVALEEGAQKALSEGILTDGGGIVPVDWSDDMIELLRNKTTVRQAGAVSVPMPRGNMVIPRQSGAATGSYTGENQNIVSSQQSFEDLILNAKKLAALTPASNELLADASPMADMIVRNDLAQVLSIREDLAFIRGDGTQNTPKGIRSSVLAANVFEDRAASGTAATIPEIVAALSKAVRLLEEGNVPMDRMGWMIIPRTKSKLMTLRDSGQWVFRDEMRDGTLLEFPFWVTNQIPKNLDVSGEGTNDETEIYLVDFSECFIGETQAIQIEAGRGVAYHDGSAVVSGFSKDQTAFKATTRHDFGLRHDVSAAVITEVDWGA